MPAVAHLDALLDDILRPGQRSICRRKYTEPKRPAAPYCAVMNTLNDLRNAGVNKVGLQTQVGKSYR